MRRVADCAMCSSSAAADPLPLVLGRDVGVADQVDVANLLDAHDPDKLAVELAAPEHDPGGQLAVELLGGHVGVVPAVGRDDAAVHLGRGVHDREDRALLVVACS